MTTERKRPGIGRMVTVGAIVAVLVAAPMTVSHGRGVHGRRRVTSLAESAPLLGTGLTHAMPDVAQEVTSAHVGTGDCFADRVSAFVAEIEVTDSVQSSNGRRVARHLRAAPRADEANPSAVRKHLAVAFAPELTSAGPDAVAILDALEAVCASPARDHLSARRSARSTEMLVRSLLGRFAVE